MSMKKEEAIQFGSIAGLASVGALPIEKVVKKPKRVGPTTTMPDSLKEKLMREYNLIKEKKSKLPRRERDAIVHYIEKVTIDERDNRNFKEIPGS